MRILIKNGRIITAVDDYEADILVEGEKISLIGIRYFEIIFINSTWRSAGKIVSPPEFIAESRLPRI